MTGDTVRLFTAVPLPPAVAAGLATVARGLRGARLVDPADMHITLRFLGDVALADLPPVKEALARVRRQPFGVQLAGLGVFHHGDGDVLYARVESVRAITDLCAQIGERLGALGFDFGARPYVPHVTLARLAGPKITNNYLRNNDKKTNFAWRADSFGLYSPANTQGAYECCGLWALHG